MVFLRLKHLIPKNFVIWPMVEYRNLVVIAKLIAKRAQKTIISPFKLCLTSSPMIKIVPMIEGMI